MKTFPTTDTELLDFLQLALGHVINGTDTTIRIFQDDAIGEYIVKAGGHSSVFSSFQGHGGNLREAIRRLARVEGVIAEENL